ncbi:Uncharacterised protein [uncultured archaeon]|nr:Uncharacterised protein [uncultured archaeon]
MKKLVTQVLVIVLLIGLPTFFIMNFGDYSSTGSVTNQNAVIRLDRLDVYLSFPVPIYNPILKKLSEEARNFLRAGARDNFYGPNRLRAGDSFFSNENALFVDLVKLSCIKHVGTIAKGSFVTPGGIQIMMPGNTFFNVDYDELSKLPCDVAVIPKAEQAIGKVLQLDALLVKSTIESSSCPEQASENYILATQSMAVGNVENALINLHVAWSKAANCK